MYNHLSIPFCNYHPLYHTLDFVRQERTVKPITRRYDRLESLLLQRSLHGLWCVPLALHSSVSVLFVASQFWGTRAAIFENET